MTDTYSAAEFLIDGVDLLCLDAGNTIIFLDHARLADACQRLGFPATTAGLIIAEGVMKNALESGDARDVAWEEMDAPGARTWGITIATILHAAGVSDDGVKTLLPVLWVEHVEKNFWCVVPEGLALALNAARGAGVRVAVISNSEGRLSQVLERVGLASAVDLAVDSGRLGIEKPDPRIFESALRHFAIPAARALHLRDTYATDVLGARAAGVRVALIDPYGHYAGRHPDVPRVAGAREVAWQLGARLGGIARQGRS